MGNHEEDLAGLIAAGEAEYGGLMEIYEPVESIYSAAGQLRGTVGWVTDTGDVPEAAAQMASSTQL